MVFKLRLVSICSANVTHFWKSITLIHRNYNEMSNEKTSYNRMST